MTVNQKRIVYALGGAAAVALLIWGGFQLFPRDEDEDRPPIIVRNGSLIIQSGDEMNPGKPWFEDSTGEWKQYHDRGKKTTLYQLEFNPASCNSNMPVREFTVVYDPDGFGGVGEQKILITLRPRSLGGKGTDAPAVIALGFDNSNKRPYPTLTYSGSNSGIARVEGPGNQVLCKDPVSVKARPREQ